MGLFDSEISPGGPLAARSARAWLTLLAACLIGLWCDQHSKSWAFEHVTGEPVELSSDHPAIAVPAIMIPPHEGIEPLPGSLLKFRLALNNGAVFGVASDRRVLLICLTTLALAAATAVFAFRTTSRQQLAHLSIGCILAGGLGNLIDRLRFGVVRDFIQLFPDARLPGDRRWPGGSPELMPWVFNIADLLLLAGTVLFLGMLWRARLTENLQDAATRIETA